MTSPRDSVTTGKAFSTLPAWTPRASATRATVVASGVCRSPSRSIAATGWASALAISVLAAYPGASATSFSPAGLGAMYSCAADPPIIPTSDSTRYHSRPTRSQIRS